MSSLQPTLANERIGVLITVAVCAVQMVFSHLWLRVFRMGPFEWLWRSATYLSWQPIIKKQKSRRLLALDFFVLFIHDTCFANDVMQAFFLTKGDHDKSNIKDDPR